MNTIARYFVLFSLPGLTAGCAASVEDEALEPADSTELAWTTCGDENFAPLAQASAESSLPGSRPEDINDGSTWSVWRTGPLYPYQATWAALQWDEGVPARCLRVRWDRADYAREMDVWIRDGYEWKFWGTQYPKGTDTLVELGTWADELQIEFRNANGRYLGVVEVEVR
jgi:hypothetical protein